MIGAVNKCGVDPIEMARIMMVSYFASRIPQICLKLISRASQSFGSPMLLLAVEGPKVPLSRGLFGFVALWCYAEECAFSLSTQVQDHAWDLAEYRRVEPAHCPTGATSVSDRMRAKYYAGHTTPFLL